MVNAAYYTLYGDKIQKRSRVLDLCWLLVG